MKLNFRDLKQQKFTIDAEPSDTIGQVKERIAAEKGWDASSQKLIYSGKILADANTVESYKIEEKGFIVCMVSKPKTAPAPKSAAPPATPAASTSTPAPPAAPQQSTSAAPAANPPATPTPAQTAAAVPPSSGAAPTVASTTAPASETSGFNDPSAMLVGNRNQAVMQQMEAMGFGREESERALRAAFYNPDRAIEYLLNGIPEHIQAEQRAAQQQQQQAAQQQRQPANPQQPAPATSPPAASATATATTETAAPAAESDEPINLFEAAAQAGQGQRGGMAARGAGAGAGQQGQQGAGGAMNMDFLRNSPHFQQLRQLVQQQPAMLEPILQQVAEGNPQLAQMIGQNQEQFLQLLSEDLVGGEGGALPPGAIAVTQEEAAAIQRLCDLGFPRERVIQAYFACDKNEELAANFLFEQPDDDDA